MRKAQIRRMIWERLTREGLALFPGVYGRTPRCSGQAEGIARLKGLDIWSGAERILVLPDMALDAIREQVVGARKTLIIPDLTRTDEDWILEIDPRRAGERVSCEAARSLIRGDHAPVAGVRFMRGRETPPVDLMVIGAVGVNRLGTRVGRGCGGADLVYALGRDRGFLRSETPVAVVVHPLQLFDEPTDREATDLPVDYIVTPQETIRIETLVMRPKGLDPCMVTPHRLECFPGLRRILEREGISIPPGACKPL
ncbi:MAG: 5-formyltetrahydrofolate cyclo-ligase [Candidatus Eisenbacteria bacterium]